MKIFQASQTVGRKLFILREQVNILRSKNIAYSVHTINIANLAEAQGKGAKIKYREVRNFDETLDKDYSL